ncbi:hypothetical protein ACFYR1_15450 [Streptomyces canus]|uniref:hypothetical protein n=1 Tax=Streptomyces canus TaxID=58343 RepID=UPI0036A7C5F7
MRETVHSVVPTDPYRRSDRAAGDRDPVIDVNGYDTVTAADRGGNPTRTGCPSCGAAIGHYRTCSRRTATTSSPSSPSPRAYEKARTTEVVRAPSETYRVKIRR